MSAAAEARPALDIVVPDLSGNVVGRALVFADLLANAYRIRLVGPSSGPIWLPLAARSAPRVVECGANGWRAIGRVGAALSAPVAIAIKPLAASFGAALRSPTHPAVILDIDDPEAALLSSNWRALVRTWTTPDGLVPTLAMDRMTGRATALTVSGEVLRQQYGGTIIPHARDEEFFGRPGVRDRAAARAALGLDRTEQVVVYVGTVRQHKGIGSLGSVARALDRGRLFVVGASDAGAVPAPAVAIPPVAYPIAMQWVAAADVVLVPQRGGAVGRAQVPAKLSDALAMGRAIVATDLPPIRAVVGDAAILVPPDDPDALRAAISALLADRALVQDLERAALRRFTEGLSFAAVRPHLLQLVEAVSRSHH